MTNLEQAQAKVKNTAEILDQCNFHPDCKDYPDYCCPLNFLAEHHKTIQFALTHLSMRLGEQGGELKHNPIYADSRSMEYTEEDLFEAYNDGVDAVNNLPSEVHLDAWVKGDG